MRTPILASHPDFIVRTKKVLDRIFASPTVFLFFLEHSVGICLLGWELWQEWSEKPRDVPPPFGLSLSLSALRRAGGFNGSIRFAEELDRPENVGLAPGHTLPWQCDGE